MSRTSAAACAALVALGACLLSGPAGAQGEGCTERRPAAEVVSTAPVAFIGTVSALADQDREATVDVIRVWRGGPLPATVRVRGNVATQAKVTTAIDRTYAKGATYLFLPTSGASPSFSETSCSSTAVLTNDLAALAPAGGGDPPTGAAADEAADASTTRLLPLAIGGAAFLVLASCLLTVRRRRPRPGDRGPAPPQSP